MRYLLTLSVVACVLFTACSKGDREDTLLRVYLGDNLRTIPFQADAVNIEIQGIKVKFQGEVIEGASNDLGRSEDWVWLDTKPGIYNLVDLYKGNVQMVASGPVPGASIKEIRFVIGKNNSVRFGSAIYPITLPTGSEYGFKIAAVKDLAIPYDSLTIDFNTAQSIQQSYGGKFALNPAFAIR